MNESNRHYYGSRSPENQWLHSILGALRHFQFQPEMIEMADEAMMVRILDYATYRAKFASARFEAPQVHHETVSLMLALVRRFHRDGVQSADAAERPDRLSRLLRGEHIELTDEETALLRKTCVTGYALLPLQISE